MAEALSRTNDQETDILVTLVQESEALTALLVTKEGVLASQAGDTSYLNVTALAALVAAMFSATQEVARLVGEKHFSILLQQGENRHIHIGLLPDSRMMVVVFEDAHRIGLVRHGARRAAERLQALVKTREQPAIPEGEIATAEFKEYALSLVDRIFQVK